MQIKAGKFWINLELEGRGDGKVYAENVMCYKCLGENVRAVLKHENQEYHYWLKCEDCGEIMKVEALDL